MMRLRVELRDLHYLTALFDAGGYGRAAKVLGVDVSTISRRISSLEDELGVLLLERTRSGIRLTAAGQDCLRSARRVLGDLDAMRENASVVGAGQSGRLKLATQGSTLGPRLRAALKAYRETHADIAVYLAEATDTEIVSGLRDRQYDAAILFTPAVADSLSSLELWTERLVLAVPSGHRLADQSVIKWSDLASETMLVRGWSGSHAFHDLESGKIGQSARFRTHKAGCVDLLNLVAINEGVMVALASHVEIAIPDLRFLEIDEPDARIGVSLAWLPELEDPLVGSFVACFRDFVSNKLK